MLLRRAPRPACGAASGGTSARSGSCGNRGRALPARDARRAGLSSRASQRCFPGDELGFISGRDDDRSGGHGATQRSRLPCRRDRLRMVERGVGRGRVPERSLCSGADCADGGAPFTCALDASADFYDGAFAVFAVARDGRAALRADGIGAGCQRRGHEYQRDGTSATAVYGTRPEYFLFFWHVSAGGAGPGGRLGSLADQPGSGVWRDRCRVCGCVWQCLLADSSTGGRGFGGGVVLHICCVRRAKPLPPGAQRTSCPAILIDFLRGEFFMFEDMKGRTAVVFGVANKRSIAWAIAQGLHAAAANIAITYQNERMEMEAKDLILSLPGAEAFMCDGSKDEEITQLFEKLKGRYGKLHALVHSVAFAPADELKGDFVNTTREGFRVAHDVSVYSLIAVCRAAAPLMEDGGSVITMTYYGAEKVVPHYNVMGVAKAALECTVRYLAQDLGRRKIRVTAISAWGCKGIAARW